MLPLALAVLSATPPCRRIASSASCSPRRAVP